MSFAKSIMSRLRVQISKCLVGSQRPISHLAFHGESPDDFNCRYECMFSRPDIDDWDVRQAMNDLMAYDLVPEPRIIIAALYACRRINDYSLAVRFLEAVKCKCGHKVHIFYPYIIQEIAPTLFELGADPPEALGYDKPELFLKDVD